VSLLVFLLWLIVLAAEGFLLAGALLRRRDPLLLVSLALPLAALPNAVLFCLYTLAGVPLTVLTIGFGHLVLLVAAAFWRWKMPPTGTILPGVQTSLFSPRVRTVVYSLCTLVLALVLSFSITHSLVLPTYQFDSLTNWTMRSKISFIDQSLAFDSSEIRGVAKPQYPFLVHALQITVQQGNAVWNDRAANAILWFFSLGACIAMGRLLTLLRSRDHALAALTVILSVPLLVNHLAHGYADIHLTEYAGLSLLLLLFARAQADRRWLILSGLMASAAAWTKTEGLLIVLVFWTFSAAALLYRTLSFRTIAPSVIVSWILWLPFPVLLLVKYLPFTPHSTDSTFQPNLAVVGTAFDGLFAGGSFGILWYLLTVALVSVAVGWRRGNASADRSLLPAVLWGLAAFALVFATYTLTPNARFLVNGESFYRQMFVPVILLVLTIAAVWRPVTADTIEKGAPEGTPSSQ
jgi:hypothetical protein